MKAATARRAVLRWAWRLFRAEWRQQILVLALLSVAVTTTTFAATFSYNMASDGSGTFGSADQRITFAGPDPAATATDIAAAERYFGTIDVIATRSVPVPGLAKGVEFRGQDPHGAYSAPMLALRQGRYPTATDEVAVTDSVAQTLEVAVGGTLALEGPSRRVVGLIENPGDLDDEFVLVSPIHADAPDRVTLLVKGGDIEGFRSMMTVAGNVERESRPNEQAVSAVLTFGLATVGLLLVALIAAAGFVVMAQRRLRELGMLAAVGATERQVRLVTLVNGVLVGLIAAAAGTSAGLVAWVAATGRVEAAAGHRIDGLSAPWWLLATSVVLAVLTATAAAWWPARAVARIPIMSALSMRPPRPKPTHRSALVAVLLMVAGVGCFALADQKNPFLIIAGMLATPIGVLFVAPLAIRAAAASASSLPIAARLALRDLGHYQARSGAALAAIILALGVPVSVVIIASASEAQAGKGNLAEGQVLIRTQGKQADPLLNPERSPAETAALDSRVGELAATLDHATVIPLDMVVDPNQALRPDPFAGTARPAFGVVHQIPGEDHGALLLLYVASPQLLDAVGADPGTLDAHEIQTAATEGDFKLFSTKSDHMPVTDRATIPDSGYSSLPDTFISPAAVQRRGWEPVRAGWLIDSAGALTGEQQAAARDLAVAAGLTVETAEIRASLSALRTGATAAGMLLALGVLAMTVGLIRSEGAGDLRTLTATGATSTVRRNLTAATAGALAALGVILGIAGAYLVMLGAYIGNLGDLASVPFTHLAATAVGVPLLATAAGWLLAGREPSALARPAFE